MAKQPINEGVRPTIQQRGVQPTTTAPSGVSTIQGGVQPTKTTGSGGTTTPTTSQGKPK